MRLPLGPAPALLAAASLLAAGSPRGAKPVTLPAVRHWAYQLQEVDLGELGASRFDLLVIDYSLDGDEESELTAEQVRILREDGPCGERIVLAYLSVGEAEDYRFYWDPSWVDRDGAPTEGAPSWLGPTNPEWEGNYKVRYWERSWQQVLFGASSGPQRSYLDRILDAGFDGVYLDIIDGYEYWGAADLGGNGERPRAAADMVRLVTRVGKYARRTRGHGHFLVVPQNGAGIIDPSAFTYAADPGREAARWRRRYLRAVDGIGAEDTFYFGDEDEDNPLEPQEETIAWLDDFAAAGQTVLAIDYLTRAAEIDDFYRRVEGRGWVPYVSRRELDRLFVPPGHEPQCR